MYAQSKTKDWPRFLPTAVKQNNVRANGAHGRPVDVEGPHSDTQNFLLQQDNARRFDQNDRVSASKESWLVHAGKFRPPEVPTQHNFGDRIGVANYGAPRSVESLGAGRVYDRHGGEHSLKLIEVIGPKPKLSQRQMRGRIYKLPT